MSMIVACKQCGKQYRVGAEMIGRRAKCQQCGEVLAIEAPEAPPNPFADFPAAHEHAAQRLAPTMTSPPGPPIGRLTDRQLRLGAAVFVPLVALGMAAAFFAPDQLPPSFGAVVVIGLGPFGIFYGIAGMISPDVLRAATKHGSHLPRRYKLIAAAIGAAALACSLPLTLSLLSR